MRQPFRKKSYLSIAEKWWKEQDESSRNFIIGGAAAVAVFFAGGVVLHAALTGLAVNGFFWYGMWNPSMKKWMEDHGRKLDVVMTVGSIGAAVVVGPTVGLSLMFIAGFFSLIRRAVCPPVAEEIESNNQGNDGNVIEGEFIPNEEVK